MVGVNIRRFVYTCAVTLTQARFPQAYINKTVSVRYFGLESKFHLSHGLFSSNDVDAGTRLLLKCVAARVDLKRLASVLDVGCGTGIIGITIARAAPAAHVLLRDRDALAVAFASENAKANSAGNTSFECGLGFWGLAGRTFDLITSNLPAKAGRPVLEDFFRVLPSLLTRTGVGAVVIVSPLEQIAQEAIQSSGCLLFQAEKTSQHAVFLFQKPENLPATAGPLEDLGPYLRTREKFSSQKVEYELETAYNLPDFDTIGYSVGLAQEVLPSSLIKGNVVFLDPGQGHLPVYLEKTHPRGFATLRLAGRDALELEITERNLLSCGRQPDQAFLLPTDAALAETLAPGSVDLLCALLHPVPKAPWHVDLARSADAVLAKTGTLLLAGESTEVFRVLAESRGFKVVQSRKRLGHRAVLLRRR